MPVTLPPLPAEGEVPWYAKRAAWDAAVETKVESLPDTFTDPAHTHTAADVTSGLLAPARIGTGTPTGSKFLRDDQVWAAPPAGGGGGVLLNNAPKVGQYIVPADVTTNGSSLGGTVTGIAVGTALRIPVAMSVDAITIRVGTADDPTPISASFLIYASDANGQPSTLAGSVQVTPIPVGVGYKTFTFTAPVALTAGLHWVYYRPSAANALKIYGLNQKTQDPIYATPTGPLGNGYTIGADVGLWNAPVSPLVTLDYNQAGNFLTPWFLLRRSA